MSLRRHPLEESRQQLNSARCYGNPKMPTNALVDCFSVEALNERYDILRVSRARRTQWITLARDRSDWRHWCPFEHSMINGTTVILHLLPFTPEDYAVATDGGCGAYG